MSAQRVEDSRPRRTRISDVAEAAGVSRMAVSYAFNKPDQLSAELRERILAIAEQLDYRPSPLARQLALGRTNQLGVLIPQELHEVLANPFIPELLRGVGDVCDTEGFGLLLVPPAQGSLAKAVDAAIVDGLLVLGLSSGHPEVDYMRRRGVPIVAVDVRNWPDTGFVAVDDEAGARAAGKHLAALGHQHVTVVAIRGHSSDDAASAPHRRLAGYRSGLGLPAVQLPHGELPTQIDGLRIVTAPSVSEDGGRRAFFELWQEPYPTAVLAMADVLAIGLLGAARKTGVAVPEQLSIVGFDDIPAAGWTNPALTTVHQPIRDLGRAAAQRLVEILHTGAAARAGGDILQTRLVVRESTARA